MPYSNVGLQSVRPRIGLQGARPLQVRWEEMRMRISTEGDKIAQGLLSLGPMSEQNLDLLEDELQKSRDRKRASEKPVSAALNLLHEECFDLRRRYHETFQQVRDVQRSLAFKGRHPLHKVLNANTDESLLSIPGKLDAEQNYRLLSWDEARVMLDQLHGAVARITDFLERLRNALAFDQQSAGDKAVACLLAMHDRYEARFAAIEQELSLMRKATLAVKTAKKEKRI